MVRYMSDVSDLTYQTLGRTDTGNTIPVQKQQGAINKINYVMLDQFYLHVPVTGDN